MRYIIGDVFTNKMIQIGEISYIVADEKCFDSPFSKIVWITTTSGSFFLKTRSSGTRTYYEQISIDELKDSYGYVIEENKEWFKATLPELVQTEEPVNEENTNENINNGFVDNNTNLIDVNLSDLPIIDVNSTDLLIGDLMYTAEFKDSYCYMVKRRVGAEEYFYIPTEEGTRLFKNTAHKDLVYITTINHNTNVVRVGKDIKESIKLEEDIFIDVKVNGIYEDNKIKISFDTIKTVKERDKVIVVETDERDYIIQKIDLYFGDIYTLISSKNSPIAIADLNTIYKRFEFVKEKVSTYSKSVSHFFNFYD